MPGTSDDVLELRDPDRLEGYLAWCEWRHVDPIVVDRRGVALARWTIGGWPAIGRHEIVEVRNYLRWAESTSDLAH